VLPVNETLRIGLKGSTPSMARPEFEAGIAPDSLPMENIVLVLQRSPQQESALQQLLFSQQTKSSPNFHKWLTPAEFGARFGPSDADLKALTDWLASHGFRVQPVSGGRTVMVVSGTAGQVKSAFHTEIHKYMVKGQEHWANSKDVEIPLALAPVVQGILSLNDFSRRHTTPTVSNLRKSSRGGTPDVTLPGCRPTGGSCYALGPGDFVTIYDVAPLYAAGIDGTGETIAIASSTNIYLRDTQSFRQIFNLPANDPNVIVIGPDPGAVPADERFANLQVQWAGAIAKNATIDLLVTQSTSATEGANLSAITAVNSNIAPILTLSYTQCEGNAGSDGSLFYSVLWEQAAAQGMTVVVPAGDTGAVNCDSHFTETAATQPLSVNAIASTPYNVAVGGTDFNQVGTWSQYWNTTNDPTTLSSAKGYVPEETWNDTCAENGPDGCTNPDPTGSDLVAGGGGVSIYNPIPVWQSSTGLPMTGGRGVPDISMFSGDGNNGSFYLYCQGDAQADPTCNLSPPYNNIQGGGGTATSAAVFAAVMALVDQYNHGPQGNANFVLYPLAANAAAGVFHDIVLGSTSVACVGGDNQFCTSPGPGYGILQNLDGPIYSAGTGYDLATGLGSVDVNNLVTKWSTIGFQPTTTTIISVNPTAPAHGQAVTFNITVTSPSGTPTGDVALMVNPTGGGSRYAADAFTLSNGSINASTTKLPGGTYTIVAHYAGDNTFAPSDSAPYPITVTPQTSQVTLSMEDYSNGPLNCFDSGQTEQYASIYYLLVVIGNPGDFRQQPSGCYPLITSTNAPTGTVTITDNGAPLGTGTYAVNGRGFIELPTQPVSIGQHQITATYSGDTSYGPSSAGTGAPPQPFFFVTITPTQSTTSLTASATLVAIGQKVTLTATVRNTVQGVASAAPPSGPVTFLNSDGTILGTANLVPNPNQGTYLSSIAQFTFAPTQQVTVNATYGGDVNYAGSGSSSVTINIGNPDFALAYSPATVNIVSGQPGTATISVTPILGFTGTVALACPASTSLPNGMTCTISPSTVTPAADGKAVTAVLTLNSQAPSTISASAIPPRQRGWTVALASSSVVLFGVLVFFGGRRRKEFALLAVLVMTAYCCGSCANVVKGQSPNSTLSLTTTAVKTPEGKPVTLTAAVSADHVVSGTVDFFDNGAQIAQGIPVNVGRGAFTTSSLTLGAHPITAAYSGDSSTNSAKTSTPLNQIITGSGQFQITGISGSLTHSVLLTFNLN